jgi:cyclic pyranopterin phosphate synthase
MDNVDSWKILRVLTSNVCNFECFFCHNEGQTKENGKPHFLKFDDFKVVLDAIKTTKIREIHFSGGEPFMNPETIKMIIYTSINTDFEIGCATNTYFLDNEIISELKNTRIKLNIQFPAVNQNDFLQITLNDYFLQLSNKLDTLKRNQINFGLNHVIHSKNIDSVGNVIDYAILNEISLKLLPQLNTVIPAESKNQIFSLLDSVSQRKLYKGTGAYKWFIKNHSSKEISVIFVDAPCFYNDFETCKQYGEIRLLPDLHLQRCINNSKTVSIFDVVKNANMELIKLNFNELWKSFISC